MNETISKAPVSVAARYPSSPDLVPTPSPLDMPDQAWQAPCCAPVGHGGGGRLRPAQLAVWAAAAVLTGGFAAEMHDVLSVGSTTPLQGLFLVLSTLAFGWVALGSLGAALGGVSQLAGSDGDTIRLPVAPRAPERRTALLFPVYHESPARIAGTVEAIAEELADLGCAACFDVYILSDTRGEPEGEREEAAFRWLAGRMAGRIAVYYRRRRENGAKKAGNIRDWVETWGAGYDHFVILDADSIMSGETLVRLALAMEARPGAGLIQTVPRLVGGRTILQCLQQFAGSAYGPAVARGVALQFGHEGSYWGHNAIIRTEAFARSAGLAALPGRTPFGGHVRSHDFVEAALLRRAGWEVHMVPSACGSYEGAPPTLVDLTVRDRRWSQGNLQHLAVLWRARLTAMGRVHLIMGAVSYLASAVWALTLLVGVLLALQSQHLIPTYFSDAKSLFPIWPVFDHGAALQLFVATIAVVMLPKVFGLLVELRTSTSAPAPGGTMRAVAGILLETLASMLLAPVLMLSQTVGVIGILLGRDSGWGAQAREEAALGFRSALRLYAWHAVAGAALAILAWQVTPVLLAWMAPVVLGLALAGPLCWMTSRPAGAFVGWVLSTPMDRSPPVVVERAQILAEVWAGRYAGTVSDAVDSVGRQRPRRRGVQAAA